MERVRKALLRNSGVLVTDFDGTLTVSGSSLHAAVHVLGADSGLARGRDALYCSMGREILDAGSAAAVSEELKARAERWWKKQMELYVEQQIPEKVLEEAAILLKPREEAAELLRYCAGKDLPVWIVSAGLENVIRFWLRRQRISGEEIHVLANRILYRGGKPVGYAETVTSWNKRERFFQRAGTYADQYLVFLGDREADLGWRAERAEGFLI